MFCLLDFQKFVYTSLTHFKYDISAMMHIVKDTNEKVQALISQSNRNNFVSTVPLKESSLDMNIFPITTEDQLMDIENKINDINFKNELVIILYTLFIYNLLITYYFYDLSMYSFVILHFSICFILFILGMQVIIISR